MKDHNGTNLVYANSVNKIKKVRHLRVTGYTCHRSRVCQWCDQRILQINLIVIFRFQGSLPLVAASSLLRVKILTFWPTPTNEPEIESSRKCRHNIHVHAWNRLDPQWIETEGIQTSKSNILLTMFLLGIVLVLPFVIQGKTIFQLSVVTHSSKHWHWDSFVIYDIQPCRVEIDADFLQLDL